MATCNICGRDDDRDGNDEILNKLFKVKSHLFCENICLMCYVWVHSIFNASITQPFKNPVTRFLDYKYK